MKFIKEIIPYAIIVIAVVIIRTFIVTPVIVSGNSMFDTLEDKDILLLKKYDKSYDRNDIVIFDYKGSKLVKRIIGLPGEDVKYIDGKLYINGYETTDEFSMNTNDFMLSTLEHQFIPEDYYFVMGDNRDNSVDSRTIGLVHKDDINGTTSFSLWPFKNI